MKQREGSAGRDPSQVYHLEKMFTSLPRRAKPGLMNLGKLKEEMAAATRVVDVYKLQNDAVDEVLSQTSDASDTAAACFLISRIQTSGLSRRIELRHCEGGE